VAVVVERQYSLHQPVQSVALAVKVVAVVVAAA
jgi:hypothetical protein